MAQSGMVSTGSPFLYQPLFVHEDSFVWCDQWVEFGEVPVQQGVVHASLPPVKCPQFEDTWGIRRWEKNSLLTKQH